MLVTYLQALCHAGALALQMSSTKVEQAVTELVDLLLADTESFDEDDAELDADSTGTRGGLELQISFFFSSCVS